MAKVNATISSPISKIKNVFSKLNATEKTNGTYVISETQIAKLKESIPDDAKVIQNKNNPNLWMIKVDDSKIIFETIKTGKPRKPATTSTTNPKPAKKTTSSVSANHKSKGDGYIILYKANGKKEQKITNMSTCAEVKEWLKTISRKNTEYLKIFDSANRECRKSAWITSK